ERGSPPISAHASVASPVEASAKRPTMVADGDHGHRLRPRNMAAISAMGSPLSFISGTLHENNSGKVEKRCCGSKQEDAHIVPNRTKTRSWLMLDQVPVGKVRLNPTSRFKRPMDVVEASSISASEKLAILKAWEIDERALQRAEDEGMGGG